MTKMLEICIDSLESADNAIKGGACRLEACAALSEGGLTPSPGLVRLIKSKNPQLPVYAMLRPRSGDFYYFREEIEVITYDLEVLRGAGADGFVFGALTRDFQVDQETCEKIISKAAPLKVTFHRAFDQVSDPISALETIITLGFERILTSGLKPTAFEGLTLIKTLVEKSQGRISIMPGSGISPKNIEEIATTSNAQEFHASAKVRADKIDNKIDVGGGQATIAVCSEDIVRQMVEVLKTI